MLKGDMNAAQPAASAATKAEAARLSRAQTALDPEVIFHRNQLCGSLWL